MQNPVGACMYNTIKMSYFLFDANDYVKSFSGKFYNQDKWALNIQNNH